MSHKAQKTAFIYICVSIFCALFGGVYEYFGHGVLSFHMIYAFAFPLVLGALPFLIINGKPSIPYPSPLSASLLHTGISTMTVGSIVQGVLDIYGTTNRLSIISVYASAILVAASIITYFIKIKK